jgi:hypothetical protein
LEPTRRASKNRPKRAGRRVSGAEGAIRFNDAAHKLKMNVGIDLSFAHIFDMFTRMHRWKGLTDGPYGDLPDPSDPRVAQFIIDKVTQAVFELGFDYVRWDAPEALLLDGYKVTVDGRTKEYQGGGERGRFLIFRPTARAVGLVSTPDHPKQNAVEAYGLDWVHGVHQSVKGAGMTHTLQLYPAFFIYDEGKDDKGKDKVGVVQADATNTIPSHSVTQLLKSYVDPYGMVANPAYLAFVPVTSPDPIRTGGGNTPYIAMAGRTEAPRPDQWARAVTRARFAQGDQAPGVVVHFQETQRLIWKRQKHFQYLETNTFGVNRDWEEFLEVADWGKLRLDEEHCRYYERLVKDALRASDAKRILDRAERQGIINPAERVLVQNLLRRNNPAEMDELESKPESPLWRELRAKADGEIRRDKKQCKRYRNLMRDASPAGVLDRAEKRGSLRPAERKLVEQLIQRKVRGAEGNLADFESLRKGPDDPVWRELLGGWDWKNIRTHEAQLQIYEELLRGSYPLGMNQLERVCRERRLNNHEIELMKFLWHRHDPEDLLKIAERVHFEFTRASGRLRKNQPALRYQRPAIPICAHDPERVLAFIRPVSANAAREGAKPVLSVCSFAKEYWPEYKIFDQPLEFWSGGQNTPRLAKVKKVKCIFNSDDIEYGGEGYGPRVGDVIELTDGVLNIQMPVGADLAFTVEETVEG